MAHPDEKMKETAKRFQEEMGVIGEAVKIYSAKWVSADSIIKQPSDFIDETKLVFTSLTNRIMRENNELYRLLDELPA